MNYMPNQYSRAIEDYDCEVVHIGGDPDAKIPMDCDAAIIAISHSSHGLFYRVKDQYKAAGKPTFASQTGFSKIKSEFEQFLTIRNYHAKTKEPKLNVIKDAFAQAKTVSAPAQIVLPAQAKNNYATNGNGKMTAKAVIAECVEADLSTVEILEMLKSHGLTRQDGRPFDRSYVHSARYQLKQKGMPVHKHSTTGTGSGAPKPKALVIGAANSQLELIGKVLAANNLSTERKMRLVERIQKGEITQSENATTQLVRQNNEACIQVMISSILSEDDKPVMTLNRFQAISIFQILPELKKFADGL
jgi:hypothetical protein